MIGSGVVVYVSCQPVDFRKGAASLMALVRDGGLDPFNGALYVFRSKRADRVRIVWWDGSGVCLHSKRLEEQSFCWPGIDDGCHKTRRRYGTYCFFSLLWQKHRSKLNEVERMPL